MLEQFGIINLWAYVIGAAVIIMIPGPNTLFVLKTALKEGRRDGFLAACAVFLGDALLILCSFLGIAALLKAHPEIFFWIKLVGALYLAYLGTKALWSTFFAPKTEKPAQTENARPAHGLKSFTTALALSLTNPKSILFYVSFFVQFIDPAYADPGYAYAILAAILEAISFVWMTTLITAGTALLRFVARRPAVAKLGNTAVGSLFMLFASKLALDA